MSKISRKTFLKGAALGAAGLAAGLAGLSAAAETGEIQWDKEAQIVVVGSGTVATAAVAAASLGAASVLVLEKDENIFGGTSITSGGTLALPGIIDDLQAAGVKDSREQVLTYMEAVGEGRMDRGIMEKFVDSANDFCSWTKEVLGFSRWGHASIAYGDYYENYAGSIADGPAHNCVPFDAEGNALSAAQQWGAYKAYLEGCENVEIMMGTGAEELITDGSGRVIGLYALSGGDRLAIKAEAVILGTGGFDHNQAMRRYYLAYPIIRTCASPNNTGDAQRMGAKIGGQLAFMDRVMGLPFCYDVPEWNEDDDRNHQLLASSAKFMDWCQYMNLPHSIMVNRKGRRFGNESRFYDNINRAFGAYDTGLMKYENIPAFWICDSVYASNYLMPGYNTPANLPPYIFQADTLEELADKMGIDRGNLVAEVARFNENAPNGIDPDWHRGESILAMNTAIASAAYLGFTPEAAQFTSPAELLGTVEQGPFYCCRYVPGSCNTRGGLLTDENAAVVDMDGAVIPGLYAVGCCSTGVAGYWCAGASLSQGCVMGYVAAKHILGE